MTTHNKLVANKIEQISHLIDQASIHQDLYDAVQLAIDFDRPLQYNFSLLKILSAIGVAIISLSVIEAYFIQWNQDLLWNIVVILCAIAVPVIYGIILFRRRSALRRLGQKILAMDSFLDNQVNPTPSAYSRVRENELDFYEFKRGNHFRKIIAEYDTLAQATEPFTYYLFKYVDKIEKRESYRDKDGNWKTRKVVEYKTYYRSGFIFEYSYANNITIAVAGDGGQIANPSDYKTASIDFNERFYLGAASEHELVKFLSPKVIEILNNVTIGTYRLEIANNGLLCLGFSNDNFLPNLNGETEMNALGLDTPQDFLAYLKGKTELGKLSQVLEFISELKRFTDNNFTDN